MATGMAMVMIAAISNMQEKKAINKQERAARELAQQNSELIGESADANNEQRQLRQSQQMGIARAAAAASGIKFDANKINQVKYDTVGSTRDYFDETGTATRERDIDDIASGPLIGNESDYQFREAGSGRMYRNTEESFGSQIAGDETGSSTFNYLSNMKKAFASEAGWEDKVTRSRQRVALFGGEIAGAQAGADRARANSRMYSSFASAYEMSAKPKAKPKAA